MSLTKKLNHLLIFFSTSVIVSALSPSFEVPLFHLWISEFPAILNSTVDSRSLALFHGDFNSFPILIETLETLSNRVSNRSANAKLYIETRPSSSNELIIFLNATQAYLERVAWMPCIVLIHPAQVQSIPEAEQIVLGMIAQISKGHFPMTTEVYVVFEFKKGDKVTSEASKWKILCDLYDKRFRSQFCNMFHFNKPFYASQEFFVYNPVSRRRRNLNRATLNIIGQYDPAYKERLSIREFANGTVEYTGGMCLDILLALQFSMNFSYVTKKGNGWVGLLENGTWTGMSAQLINGEADLSVAQASFIMMIDQMKGISFLQPSGSGQFVALFRQPRSSVNVLTSVMPRKGWILAGVAWAVVLLSVFVTALVHRKSGNISKWDMEFVRESVLWALTTACQKGYYVKPTSLTLRIICVVASFLAICIYVACSAKLTGNLVSQEVPIKTFRDLSRSKLEVYTDKWLPVARGLIENIYNQRGVQIPHENSRLYTIEDGLPLVILSKKAPIALVTFSDAVTTVFSTLNKSDNYFCETVSTVTVATARTPAGMFVRKGSPLKEILNYNVLMLVESGIVNRLNQQYEDKTQIKCEQLTSFYRGGLHLRDLTTSFKILFGGGAITIAIFISERIFSCMSCRYGGNKEEK